jgi:hypothetical protein
MERFNYHASATGVAGRIEVPFDEILPIQGSLALPPSGGFGSVRVHGFHFRDILSFSSVTSVVAGSRSDRDETFDALATTTIENLDVLGVVTADRIVARIASIHPEAGGPPMITPLASHFENLRIAGYRVDVDLATDTFARLDTAEKVRKAYREDVNGFRREFDELSLLGKHETIPSRLQAYFPWRREQAGEVIPERNGEIHCGLVREIAGLGSEIVCHGHSVYLRGFGAVRLAELRITDFSRQLTMLQIDLGSTPKGHVSSGGVEGNGSGY